MENLNITERHYKSVTILDLAGKIRLGEGNVKLRATLRQAMSEGKNRILLNLAEVSHIDSSGLGELVAGFVSLRKSGGELKLLHLNQRVRELMVITKLLTVFEVFEDEQDAVAGFQTPAADSDIKQSEAVSENSAETRAAFKQAK